TELQRALLARGGAGAADADVLKLPHHGSGYPDLSFLAAVTPAVAGVTVGEGNPYGHPHPPLLARLRADGAPAVRPAVGGAGGRAGGTRGRRRGRGRGAQPRGTGRHGPGAGGPPAAPSASQARARMGGVSSSGRIVLVLGDEELLVARAVEAAVAAVRAADPGVEVHDHEAAALSGGEVASLLSPSLFGGSRVLVVRAAQDARKDLAEALLAYAAHPQPDVTLVVAHAGGAKGRALADGLRRHGAEVVSAARLTRHRERVEFIQAEVRRLGGRCPDDAAEALLAAVGSDLRELAAACSQLVADTGGRLDAATVARYYRGRAEVSGFTVADAVMAGDVAGALEALRWALQIGVNPVPIADALADGV